MEDGKVEDDEAHRVERGTVGEVARLFLRLGFTAFGGPAAHIAMYHDEVVTRRKWITEQHFLDMLGATNLIPGPNSTEMALHIGYVRAGWRGLLAAGLCFILPAASIVLILSMLYVQYGTTPAAESLLYGIKPVMVAVIIQAIWNLGRKAVKSVLLGAVGLGVLALYLRGINELLLLFGGALLVMIAQNWQRLRTSGAALLMPFALLAQTTVLQTPYSVSQLFLTFLKIGAVLYGSGYVLIAFLRSDFVDWLGWLTDRQLLDAVAIGQFTPGPVFTTATFIGYILGGFGGAIAATVAIFLPSFIFVLITNPLIPRMRQSKWLSSLLDGVNVAAIGLMAAVTLELGRAALVDVITLVLGVLAAILLIRYKINSTWLIIGGGIVGIVYRLLMG